MAPGQFLVPMITELDGFEARIRDLAHEIVARVFAAELQRRAAAGTLTRGARDPGDDGDDADRAGAADAGDADDAAGARDQADADAPASPSPTRTADAPPGRGQWTRDLVVKELATWLLGGNPVEASYLIRHRQRALVVNAKKFFGRFEAALNAANLKLAQDYPEGIPNKKGNAKRS